ncbi:MAG: class IV adenylate cyclase [bacterium]
MAKGIEVENKARVDDLSAVEGRLPANARFLDHIDYADTYFTFREIEGYTYERFRLREFSHRAIVTAKEDIASVECATAREYEFEISDADAFLNFVRLFGFRELIRKRKQGKRFEVPSDLDGERAAIIELVNIEGLGDFVEIEVMVENEDRIERAESRVMALLAELGILESALEPRAYTLMLYKQNREQESG